MKHNSFNIYHQSKDKKLNSKVLRDLYSFMKKLRICEDQIEEEYHPKDQMRCPVHFCTGQEAVPASLYKLIKKMIFYLAITGHMVIIYQKELL